MNDLINETIVKNSINVVLSIYKKKHDFLEGGLLLSKWIGKTIIST